MDFISILIIGSAIIVILLLWVIVGIRHLNRLRCDIEDAWELVDERIRKRHNLIPNLIETVRLFDSKQDSILKKIIDERARAMKEYYPSSKKIEIEHDLSYGLKELIALSKHSKELSTDTNFLELTSEIRQTHIDVEKNQKIYNEKVRLYNKHRSYLILRPIILVKREKPINIFEFQS